MLGQTTELVKGLTLQGCGEHPTQDNIFISVQVDLSNVNMEVLIYVVGTIVLLDSQILPIGREGSLYDVGDKRILELLQLIPKCIYRLGVSVIPNTNIGGHWNLKGRRLCLHSNGCFIFKSLGLVTLSQLCILLPKGHDLFDVVPIHIRYLHLQPPYHYG